MDVAEFILTKEADLFVRLTEYKCSLKEGHFDKTKLVLHSLQERHKIKWTQARILQFDSNAACSKYY